jgi:hypothetical protein
MNRVRRAVGIVVGLGAPLVLAISCASAPQKKQDEAWPAATRNDYQHEEDPCLGEGGEPVHCTGNDECCKGFVCSLDPGRSRIIRYCLQG